MKHQRSCVFAAMIALAVTGCSREPATTNQSNLSEEQADAALDNALNAVDDGGHIASEFAGTLAPPAPGEPGGLPDDRAPLNEAAARIPTSVEASGATIEQWGVALGEERYGDAYKLWRDGGKQSGMTEAQYADTYRKYSEIRVLVGRPQAGGTETARVPVQMYGRLREGGKPFNLYGMMTLARNPAGQKGEAGQTPWLIANSELKPLGIVKIESGEAAAAGVGQIPVAFRGNWSASKTSCTKAGDDMRLAVGTDSLTFYESVGQVKAVKRLAADRVELRTDYNGEGDKWSETTTLALADGGKALTIGNIKRVRCVA